MNLTQLRYVVAITKYGFSISAAAEALHTSQPGVSAQIRALEEELGSDIFIRYGKRVTGLTETGIAIHELAEEALLKISAIKTVAQDHSLDHQGVLSIATTHTQARYALPTIITAFVKQFPRVQLHIHQGNPEQISEMVINGDADIAIATEAIGRYEKLIMLPVYRWNRCVIAPPDHPILNAKKLTLKAIAQYPIITYDHAFAGRSVINRAFTDENLKPNVVLTAIDSDVIKHYVKLGLGIGLLAKMAFDDEADSPLQIRDAGHLFDDSVTSIGIRKGRQLRGYMSRFIMMFAPHLNEQAIATGDIEWRIEQLHRDGPPPIR